MDARRKHGQDGAAALTLTVLLLFAMLLVVAATQRSAATETQASAGQLRASQAFEAAEAGLEWATARLDDDTRLDDDCRPSAAADALSLRDRLLSFDPGLPGLRPVTWNDAGTARAQQVACRHDDAGWTCRCPRGAVPSPPVSAASTSAPSFVVALAPGPRPGMVTAGATGCTQDTTACVDAADIGHEATTRLEVVLALVPGLRSAPVAALTVRGDVAVGPAALGVRNDDAGTGGIAVDAGGRILASGLRIAAPAGSPLGASLISGDASLTVLPADRLFARWFGMSPAAWAGQPAIVRLSCHGDCTAEVVAAIAAGRRLVAIAGDALLAGDLELGSAARPIALVVDGALGLRGNLRITGVVHASAIDWQAASAGAAIRGAVLTAGDYTGDAAGDIVHDADVLARLQAGAGSFVRVNGSWKDF